jgi:hypothetical protein
MHLLDTFLSVTLPATLPCTAPRRVTRAGRPFSGIALTRYVSPGRIFISWRRLVILIILVVVDD